MPVSPVTRPPLPSRRAVTLVEILVALAVTAVLATSVGATFVSIMKASKDSEVNITATANGRAALSTMVREIKAGSAPFVLTDNPDLLEPTGDGYDNDGDGVIDEERPDGRNDDAGPWADRHVLINGRYERPDGVGIPDLGDDGVDEDTVFNLDRLAFTVSPSDGPAYQVAYRVDAFDGQDRVLVRTVNGAETAPLAFDVVSFNVLCWDPVARQWLAAWNAAGLPATVSIEIVVDADPRPLDSRAVGAPFRTASLRTVVAVERAIP